MGRIIDTEVVIVGAGPGGAATAIYLAQKGIRSILVEKERFPRYHIGESLTGEVGLRIRELGLEEYMTVADHPRKFSVKVFGPEGNHTFTVPVMKRTDNGELKPGQTWQVPRDLFDRRMLEEAEKLGARLVPGKASGVIRDDGVVKGITVRGPEGEELEINSRVVVDASGSATFLHGAGVTSRKNRGSYDKQLAVYSQLAGGVRCDGDGAGDTLILYRAKNHWAWFIPLSRDVVSVGVVVPSAYYKSSGESLEAFFRREIRELNPELDRRFPEHDLQEPVRATSNYSYFIDCFAGAGWLCVGDSHRFIDPVFSFGLHFAVHEAKFAAEHIAAALAGDAPMDESTFAEYQELCSMGMDNIEEVVDAFWNQPHAFAFAAHVKYREDIIDMFAGRIYDPEPSGGLLALKKINEKYRSARQQPRDTQSS